MEAKVGFFSAFVVVVVSLCVLVSAAAGGGQEADKIAALPGQPANVGFSQYSGYVTVDAAAGRALFYWLVEAPEPSALRPLVLWLNGGPGCSSVAYGAAEEIGPFHINPDAQTLYSNPYAWNKLPLTSGIFAVSGEFAVSGVAGRRRFLVFEHELRSVHGWRPENRILIGGLVYVLAAEDAYAFLVSWFERFPQYKHREFYIAGESYAGKCNKDGAFSFRSGEFLQRIVGNAVTDDYHDLLGTFEYWWTHGLISDDTYHTLRLTCQFVSSQHPSVECEKALDVADDERGNIDPYSIYTPPCNSTSLGRRLRGRHPWMYRAYDPCTERYSTKYFNRPDVQKALHANLTGLPYSWETCSDIVGEYWADSPRSMLPIYRELVAAGLRIWVYSGDTDSVVPVTATRYSIDALELRTVIQWFPWYDSGKVGGWSQDLQNILVSHFKGEVDAPLSSQAGSHYL
ncbi:hypothetical protein ACLOJK_001517 [Asimina triloba]